MARKSSTTDPRALIREVFMEESSHMSLDEAVADFPMKQINAKAPNVSFSFWQIPEHNRITQWDLLEYAQNAKHVSPGWPDGYWPKSSATTDAAGWKKTIAGIKADLKRMDQLLTDPKVDIFAPVPFANNKSILRCTFLAVDHNSYHLGEF